MITVKEIRKLIFCLILGLFIALLPVGQITRADQIIADMSEHLIEIRSNYTGTSLLLFGAIDWTRSSFERPKTNHATKPPFDVIIVMQGPTTQILVRKKEKIAGVWVNRRSVLVRKAPSFYAVLATRPVQDILTPDVLDRHEFNLEHLKLEWPQNITADQKTAFREALLRNMKRDELYIDKTGTIEILGSTLFRTRIYFPVSVPVGAYQATVYLVRDGRIIATETSPLAIGKEGVERAIYDFAHENPALYGLSAILVALVAGLLAGEISRRMS